MFFLQLWRFNLKDEIAEDFKHFIILNDHQEAVKFVITDLFAEKIPRCKKINLLKRLCHQNQGEA